uniref:Uncharacterized protein n=1 Tax=Clytia hemisphaerica TaxID=252671 RepID=A0A7M5V2V8_9CNID
MDDSFEPVIEINKDEFTDQERRLILEVVARDEDVLRQEKSRIEHLQDELQQLEEKGVPEEDEATCGRICRRCRSPLGLVLNSGALCVSCSKTVCKDCRVETGIPSEDNTIPSWICTVCGKIREIRAESGAWFYQTTNTESDPEIVKKKKKKKAYGSFLMKKVFSKVKRSDTVIYKDPDWSEVLHKDTIAEEDEDNTYLVVSPSSSGTMNVKEGNDSTEPSSTSNGGQFVVASSEPSTSPHLNRSSSTVDAHTYSTSDQTPPPKPSQGLTEDERNTLLSIVNHNSRPSSLEVTHEELMKQDTAELDNVEIKLQSEEIEVHLVEDEKPEDEQEAIQEEETEKPSQASIYYNPGDDDSSSDEEESQLEQNNEISNEDDENGEELTYETEQVEPEIPVADELSIKEETQDDSLKDIESTTVANVSDRSEETIATFELKPETVNIDQDVSEIIEEKTELNPFELIDDKEIDDKIESSTPSTLAESKSTTAVSENTDIVVEKTINMNIEKSELPTIIIEDDTGKVNIIPADSTDDKIADQKASTPPPGQEEEYLDELVAEFNQHADIGDADSIGSDYSDEEDIAETVQVAGELLLGFRYVPKEKLFEVQVHKAKDLIIGDSIDNSTDPYVKIYLRPETKRSAKRKTKVKKKTLNPDFDEILSFKLEYDQLISRTVAASVWHSSFTQKNKCLGEALISIDEYLESGFSFDDPTPQWYTLKGRTIKRDQVEFCGDLVANIWFKAPGFSPNEELGKKANPVKGSLEVHCIRAQNLKALHEGGFSNPFCKMVLISKNSKHDKFKTHHIKGTIDPYWDKQFSFTNVQWVDLQDAVLQFSVWDVEKGSSHVLLGGARLGLGRHDGQIHDSFGEEVEIWQKVLDYPNESKEYFIPLRSTLDSVKQKAFAPPMPVKIMTISQHEEEKKTKFGSLSNLSAKKLLNADTISLASTGSMLSLYSMAGGEHGNLTITGELLFSVKYDDLSGIFSINIEKAKGLAAVDAKKMTSDPYVKVYLLPDKNKTSKKKTMHRRKTINPIWNETIKYKLSKEDLLQKTLQLTIWNHDRLGKNDCLGEVQLNMKQYANTNKLNEEQPVWYTLQSPAPVVGGGADDNIGELVLGLKYDNEQLIVTVKEAKGLTSLTPNKMPNPFVKCYLLPDKSRKSKRKTGVQKKTNNPMWNEKFTYKHVSIDDLNTRAIEITVWDYDSSAHQFLGGVRLGLPEGDEPWKDSFKDEVHLWESMMNHLGILAEYTIPLRKTMTSVKNEQMGELPSVPMITEMNEPPKQSFALSQPSIIQEEIVAEGIPSMRLSLQWSENVDEVDKKKKKANKGVLKVILKEAKCLPEKPDGDVPSAYCKAILHPKKKSEKFATETYYKSSDPKWDANIVFEDVSLEELRTRCMEITLYDDTVETKRMDKGLHFASLRLGSGGLIEKWDDSQGPEIDLWFNVLNNPETWNTKLIPLRVDEYPEAKPKKSSSGSFKLKNITQGKSDTSSVPEEEFSDDETEQPAAELDRSGSESPRTSALRAMGGDAAQGVINMMNEQTEQTTFEAPYEGLTTISEENEIMNSVEIQRAPSMAPSITITQDVRAGDPPFAYSQSEQKENSDDDEPQFDYPIPDKSSSKKMPPQMSLLKRSTSMTSIYSTDSANVYGQVPIRGEVQFGLKYDTTTSLFEVHVFKAKGIAAVDTKKETTDPYCKVYLLPDRTKAGKKKTRTRKKTLNPEWDEILEFKINIRDLRLRTLSLTIWHQEKLGRNVFLGEVMQDMSTLLDNGSLYGTPTTNWYDLQEKAQAPTRELYRGELYISLCFEDDNFKGVREDTEDEKKKKKKKKKKDMKSNGRVNIHILKATDLPAADKDGASDPFCKVYLLPMKQSKHKRKTPVIRDTLCPVWDYRTEYDIDYEDLGDHGIEFSVWDWDRGNSNDLLGCARIGPGNNSGEWDDANGVEIEAWRHMIDNPNVWKEFKIKLRSELKSRNKKK